MHVHVLATSVPERASRSLSKLREVEQAPGRDVDRPLVVDLRVRINSLLWSESLRTLIKKLTITKSKLGQFSKSGAPLTAVDQVHTHGPLGCGEEQTVYM